MKLTIEDKLRQHLESHGLVNLPKETTVDEAKIAETAKNILSQHPNMDEEKVRMNAITHHLWTTKTEHRPSSALTSPSYFPTATTPLISPPTPIVNLSLEPVVEAIKSLKEDLAKRPEVVKVSDGTSVVVSLDPVVASIEKTSKLLIEVIVAVVIWFTAFILLLFLLARSAKANEGDSKWRTTLQHVNGSSTQPIPGHPSPRDISRRETSR